MSGAQLRVGLTAPEAAELLGVSVRGIYRSLELGELPCIEVAGRKIIPAAKLVELFGDPVVLADPATVDATVVTLVRGAA